jgi:hypothetical protein
MGSHASQKSRPEVTVVYLARKAEGIAAFQAFARSYAAHPAGINHDLVVIFKGYDGNSDLAEARAVFSSFPHIPIELPDEGFDLGSYLTATQRLPHEYVCCLNTFSRILADGWLKKLHAHAKLPDVGIVGATGSYEGLRDTITFVQKGIWMSRQLTLNEGLISIRGLRDQLCRYFEYFLGSPSASLPEVKSVSPTTSKGQPRELTARGIVTFLYQEYLTKLRLWILERAYQKWWNAVLKDKQNSVLELFRFPPFPNPHIRTNAFMIKRGRFLSFKNTLIVGKMDASRFESGDNNMTRQILIDGLKTRIVGRNGIGYDIADWPNSNTFRLGNQDNLLVADNQTVLFETFSEESRTTFALMSWGKNNISLPQDFPELGVKFQVDRNAMQTFLRQLTPRASIQDRQSYTLSLEESFL